MQIDATAVLTADVMSRIERAAVAAARTYRFASYGLDSADVAQSVAADIFGQHVRGERPFTSPAEIGRMAKRTADRMRRAAEKEQAADVLAEIGAADGAISDADSGERQHAAVLGRKAMHGAPKRTDVLAVAESSRENMRAAEDCYLANVRYARLLAELDSAYVPERASDSAAWKLLHEVATAAHVPSHGIGTADEVIIAADGERTEPMHGAYAADSSGRYVGRSRLFVCSMAKPMATADERRELRRVERAARTAVAVADENKRTADVLAESTTADVLAVAVAVAVLTAASDVLADAMRAHDTAALNRQLATRERPAMVTATYRAETVSADVPAGSAADVLLSGYAAEELAERVSAKRERKATSGRGFNPAPIVTLPTADERDAYRLANGIGRNWLLKTNRHVRWIDVLPSADTNMRRAVQRAAVAYGRNALGSVSRSFDIDANMSAYRAAVAERRESAVDLWHTLHGTASTSARDEAKQLAAVWGIDATFSRIARTSAAQSVAAVAVVESTADVERAELAALREAYGFGNKREAYGAMRNAAIDAAWNPRKPWLSTADVVRKNYDEWLEQLA